MSEINFVIDSFSEFLKDVPFYPAVGNHDIFLQDQFSAKYPLNF